MESLMPCSVGILLKTECYQSTFTFEKTIKNVSDLSNEEKDLLLLRTEIADCDLKTVCSHHNYYYLKAFESYERRCCDPNKIHKKSRKKSLRTVSLDFSKSLIAKGILVKPGQKLCTQCRNFCEEKIQAETSDESDEDQAIEFDSSQPKKQIMEDVNKILDDLGCSPVKMHAVPSHSKESYGKRKLESAEHVLKQRVSAAFNFPIESSDKSKEDPTLLQKAKDFDDMLSLMKEKIASVLRSKKLQILTLAPPSWSKEKVAKFFNVSDHLVRQARKLKNKKGILSLPDSRKGKSIPKETIELVTNFYQNDENSRILSGAKDKVSIKKNEYMQKRLILYNLKELFFHFKSENLNVKIGFSKFCTLRPKWCVLAGASGTHSVCVCSIHQNVKLLLDAAQIEEGYHYLIKLITCNTENPECMLRQCDNCPQNIKLEEFLKIKLDYFDPDDEIEYTQWIGTDRMEMMKQTNTIENFINLLIHKLNELKPHSYIAKSQSKALKNLKENLTSETAIILMDFSENYNFVVQNEVQSYHWTRGSCSIHPVVVYLKNANDSIVSNHCFISNDLDHDVCFVHAVQIEMINWLRNHHINIKSVHYFTDGCAGQYKNKKMFKNLCEHFGDFKMYAEHSFFATSHGKNTCDGIGGTVKRILRKASLQQPDSSQIMTASEVFEFCKNKITNISFHFLKKEDIDLCRKNLEKRFSGIRTIPGTRSFHYYKPLSSNCLETKRTTDHNKLSMVFTFDEGIMWKYPQPMLNSFVAAVYDENWYFAIVNNIFHEEGDLELLFLHPSGPATSFYWPLRKDICLVPMEHILCSVSAPSTSSSGRMYHFSKLDLIKSEHNYMKWTKHRKEVYKTILKRNN